MAALLAAQCAALADYSPPTHPHHLRVVMDGNLDDSVFCCCLLADDHLMSGDRSTHFHSSCTEIWEGFVLLGPRKPLLRARGASGPQYNDGPGNTSIRPKAFEASNRQPSKPANTAPITKASIPMQYSSANIPASEALCWTREPTEVRCHKQQFRSPAPERVSLSD